MIFVRWAISAAMAAGITAGLFYFMQFLIATGERFSDPVEVIRVVDATMPDIELDVVEEIERPEPIEEVVQDDVEIPDKQISLDSGPSIGISRQDIDIGDGLDLSPTSISSADGEQLPLVTIAPQYPTRAAQRGIEGWCLVSFSIDGLGNVIEDSIVVVDAEPPNLFDRASVRAVTRFKYQPRVVDGVGVQVDGLQYVFRYELEE